MGVAFARLEITNGTDTVKLVNQAGINGFQLKDWSPAIANLKGGGVWQNSTIADGRQLVMRNWENVAEAFTLDISGYSQIDIIAETQALRALIEQARDYWVPRSTVGPVWIVAQADCEDNPRFAYIYDGQTPNDDNPYGPGFGGATPMFEDWQFAIERGHWMDVAPGSSTCVELSALSSGYTYGADLVLNGSFETAGGGGADVFANWTEVAGAGAITQDAAIFYLGTKSAKLTMGAYIQQNIAVVAGSVYAVMVKEYSTALIFPPSYEILNITAGGSVIAETRFPATPVAGVWYPLAILVTVPAGCVSIGIKLNAGTEVSNTYFDFVSCKLLTEKTFGQEATCDREIYIPNHSSPVQLTDIYHYDSSIATFSANLISAALPFNLFPDPVDVNDALYIGVNDASLYSGPFSAVVFDLIPNTGIDGTWQYWSGAAWSNIVDYTDATADIFGSGTPFSKSGVCSFVFKPPTNWARTTVNGQFGFWIRCFKFAGAPITPVPQQQNRAVYVPTLPYANIAAAQIPGDISALTDTDILGHTGESAVIRNLIWATRKVSRGSSFDPFLNLSDVNYPDGITGFIGANTAYVNKINAPTGRAIRFNCAAADFGELGMIITSPLAQSYKGTFRVLLRCDDLNPTLLTAELIIQAAGAILIQNIAFGTSTAGQMAVFDFGKVTIPRIDLSIGENIPNITFFVTLTTTNAGGTTAYVYDLILIPVEESVAEVFSNGFYGADYNMAITIDSIFPKRQIKSVSTRIQDGYIFGGLGVVSTTQAQLQHDQDQRLMLIAPQNYAGMLPEPYRVLSPTMTRVSRYLSMRGDR